MCRSRCSPSVHLISISVASTMCQTLFCPDRRGCTWSGPSSGRGTGIPQRSCHHCRPTGRGQTCAPAAASSSDRAPWLPPPAWAAKDPDRLVNSGNVLWLLLGFLPSPNPCLQPPEWFPFIGFKAKHLCPLLPAWDTQHCGNWPPRGHAATSLVTAFYSFWIISVIFSWLYK